MADLTSKRWNYLMHNPLRINNTNFFMCRLQGQNKSDGEFSKNTNILVIPEHNKYGVASTQYATQHEDFGTLQMVERNIFFSTISLVSTTIP